MSDPSEPLPDDAVWRFDEGARLEAERALADAHPVRTICNVIRKLHAECTTESQRELCREAIWMAKRMDRRLRSYKFDWDRGIWLVEGSAEGSGAGGAS